MIYCCVLAPSQRLCVTLFTGVAQGGKASAKTTNPPAARYLLCPSVPAACAPDAPDQAADLPARPPPAPTMQHRQQHLLMQASRACLACMPTGDQVEVGEADHFPKHAKQSACGKMFKDRTQRYVDPQLPSRTTQFGVMHAVQQSIHMAHRPLVHSHSSKWEIHAIHTNSLVADSIYVPHPVYAPTTHSQPLRHHDKEPALSQHTQHVHSKATKPNPAKNMSKKG